MVRPGEYRTRKYAAKMDPDVIADRFEKLADHMRYGMRTHIPALAVVENEVKIICERHGIKSWQLPFYMNVARQLYRIVMRHIGDTAKAEAQLVANTWATRGLDTTVIAEICKLFGFEITPTSWY